MFYWKHDSHGLYGVGNYEEGRIFCQGLGINQPVVDGRLLARFIYTAEQRSSRHAIDGFTEEALERRCQMYGRRAEIG